MGSAVMGTVKGGGLPGAHGVRLFVTSLAAVSPLFSIHVLHALG